MSVEMNDMLLKQIVEEQIPFCKLLHVKFVQRTDNAVVLKIPYTDALIGDSRRPALHGGVISTLLDTVGGAIGLTTLVLPDDRLSTVDIRVDFLRPGEPKDIYAEGRIVRSGNRIIVTEMTAYHLEPKKIIAEGKGVYNVRRKGD